MGFDYRYIQNMQASFFLSKAFFRAAYLFLLGAWLICTGFKWHYENESDEVFQELRHFEMTSPHSFSWGTDMSEQQNDSVKQAYQLNSAQSEALVNKANNISKNILHLRTAQRVTFSLAAIAFILWIQSILMERLKREMKT